MNEKKDRSWIVRTSDHRSYYITGAIPSNSEDDIRLHVYNEVVDAKDREIFISNAQIIMSRTTATRLIEVLKNVLEKPPDGHTKVISIPQEAAFWMEDTRPDSKKKVQKIRVK
jgi:hypothetical protein